MASLGDQKAVEGKKKQNKKQKTKNKINLLRSAWGMGKDWENKRGCY